MRRNRRILALLLCLALLFLTGCSGGKDAPTKDDAVSYSRMVYPGMEMTAEQKNAVSVVSSMLSAAELDSSDETLTMENTTGLTLTGTVTIRHFAEDGTFLGESHVSMDEWPAGGQMRAVANRDSAGWTGYSTADIGAEFLMDGVYLATEYQPIGAGAGSSDVNLRLWKDLPLRLIFDDYRGKRSYLLTEVTVEKNNTYKDIKFVMTMERGSPAFYDYADFRILRSGDGVVVEAGTFSVSYLQPGETAWVHNSYLELDGGDYTMEIYGAKVESATQADVDAVLGAASGASASASPAPSATPQPTSTPEPVVNRGDWDKARRNIEALIESESYYEAAMAIDAARSQYPDQEDECDTLMGQIKAALQAVEPKTGELERTFQYQGGNQVQLTALSGPLEVTIRDVDKSSNFVRFYVRQFETSLIYLPAGTYTVAYKIGQVWFDDEIGFGELCSEHQFSGELEFKTTQDNAWITNYRWAQVI